MVRYFFRISYIGTKYRGTQKIVEFPNDTIQGVVESGLHLLNPANVPLTHFASRTDKGVHALMNTFHVDLEHRKQGEVYQPNIVKKVLNTFLQENNHEILVQNCIAVPQSFHSRFHVKWRSYRYRLAVLKPQTGVTYSSTKEQIEKYFLCEEYLPISEVNRCHAVPSDIDVNIVKDVVNLYSGSHDFATFTKYTLRDPWKLTKRAINEFKFYELPAYNCMEDPHYSNITLWEFYIKSTSFLYHQIRKMVGSALAAGFGNLSVAEVKFMLENPCPSGWLKSRLAPACGLYLSHLHYNRDGYAERNLSNAKNAETCASEKSAS